MADDDLTIQPKSVRLAHHPDEVAAARTKPASNRLPWLLIGGIIIGGVLIFALLPDPAPRQVAVPPAAGSNSAAAVAGTSATDEEIVAPFEAVQREKARKEAQEALGDFVKLQLRLEEQYQVEAWAKEAYDAAIATANQGDDRFLNADYEPSIEHYEAAREQLRELLDRAETTFKQAYNDALAAIIELDQAVAEKHVELALTLKPKDREARKLARRAGEIPKIIELDNDAKVLEEERQWVEALATLEKLKQVEPLFPGVDERLQTARSALSEIEFQNVLTQAFSALNARSYQSARKHFNQALALQPGNPVALGGLQQVQAFTEVRRIDQLRATAQTLVQNESWAEAIETFDAMLTLEPALQFARQGKADAEQAVSIEQILGRIIEAPEKLSAPKLFQQAGDVLVTAQGLGNPGPRMREKTAKVVDLLDVYSQAVLLKLTSDNATSVAITSHGRLGVFSETSVELRPGKYTIMGSRDGCRDIRKEVMVLPGIEAIDIRCEDML